MKSIIQFDSVHYREIRWKDIFYSAACSIQENHIPMGIVNTHGIAMLSDNMLTCQTLKLCLRNENRSFDLSTFTPIHQYLLEKQGIFIYQINITHYLGNSISQDYLRFIQSIINNVFDAVRKMFTYTCEHLSHRQYNHQCILTCDIVQNDIAEILIFLKKFQSLSCNSFNQIMFAIDILLTILNKIAKLSGARAIFDHHVLNLLFHLNYFQRFII